MGQDWPRWHAQVIRTGWFFLRLLRRGQETKGFTGSGKQYTRPRRARLWPIIDWVIGDHS